MKKILKISALGLAVIIMCMSFCGCAELDEQKESQAFWTEAGSKDSITYNGKTYKLLENNEYHNPQYNHGWGKTIFVTEPDVPILLSTDFGIDLQLSSDGTFISGYISDKYEEEINNPYIFPFYSESSLNYTTENGHMVYYCDEEIYDEITAEIDKGINYTGYGYEYWSYDKNSSEEAYNYCYLSDEDAKLLDKILKEVEPVQSALPYEYMSICMIDEVSEDKHFGKMTYELHYDTDGNFYLSSSSETGIFTIYEIPEKYEDDFKRMFEYALKYSEYSNVLEDFAEA